MSLGYGDGSRRPQVTQRRAWLIVAGAFIGLIVGAGPILNVSFALFIKPVTQDFGWSRGAFSSAPLVAAVGTIVMQPVFGWLMDRYGVKRAALPFVIVMALCLFALSRITGTIAALFAIYAVAGVASCAQAPPMYSKVVALWFDRQRGLALAIATTGAAVGNIVIPLFAQRLIADHGWRTAYVGLAGLNLVIAGSAILLLLEEPSSIRAAAGTPLIRGQSVGLTLGQALRHPRFWILAAIFLLMATGLNGTLAHSVALLTDRGWSASGAVRLLSVAGLANVVGRFAAGSLLDRSDTPRQTALLLLVPIIGSLLLASNLGGLVPIIAVPLISFAYGAEIDVMAFLVSRYFGLANFGQIYGAAFSAFAIGTGLGPILMGKSHDATGSYTIALSISAAALIIALVAMRRLDAYIFTTQRGR